ncbi:MAG: NAD(+) synthase, partial [Bdellovibrionales bacterium RIFOXYB2_FULL_36_6]
IDNDKVTTTWESLFVPNIITNSKKLPHLKPLTDHECLEAIEALGFGVNEYARKCGFNKFLVALSGGIDSCLVLTILKLHLTKTQNLEAIYMPSKFSGELSLIISKQLCQNLKIPFYILPIEDVKATCKSLFTKHLNQDLQGLADENIQSRLRSTLLLARANQTNAIAINTSNKSEIAVGYSTIYGDSVGAISLLGDFYKSEVYMLAQYINKAHHNIIPLEAIQRPPTAELRDNQKDTDSLPPYDILDVILEGILSYRFTAYQMIEMGLSAHHVLSVYKLYMNSEYKRSQFCPIIKIKPK